MSEELLDDQWIIVESTIFFPKDETIITSNNNVYYENIINSGIQSFLQEYFKIYIPKKNNKTIEIELAIINKTINKNKKIDILIDDFIKQMHDDSDELLIGTL